MHIFNSLCKILAAQYEPTVLATLYSLHSCAYVGLLVPDPSVNIMHSLSFVKASCKPPSTHCPYAPQQKKMCEYPQEPRINSRPACIALPSSNSSGPISLPIPQYKRDLSQSCLWWRLLDFAGACIYDTTIFGSLLVISKVLIVRHGLEVRGILSLLRFLSRLLSHTTYMPASRHAVVVCLSSLWQASIQLPSPL